MGARCRWRGPCTLAGMSTARTLRFLDDLVFKAVLGSIAAGGLGALVCGLYLVKSGLGIDLMDGPSPLHQFFF